MCAVPRLRRQPGRAEARRLDGLRAAGAEGHGDVGHRSEPEDGAEGPVELAVHPALPRHRVLALDRPGARLRDRRPVRRQGDTGAGRFADRAQRRRRSDDGDVRRNHDDRHARRPAAHSRGRPQAASHASG